MPTYVSFFSLPAQAVRGLYYLPLLPPVKRGSFSQLELPTKKGAIFSAERGSLGRKSKPAAAAGTTT